MDDKSLVAIIAAISAIIGGLISLVIGPVIKHRLDQSAADRERKKEGSDSGVA